ncbi:hypothetical protein [Apilactobacillus timberlakei]|uniref:DUF2758 domain-containing protein n=1 Tax=Apilactobacillus timberlakei TaxID=2008380 RepID=A0ABY2YRV6_9LACO|nr:hypothetical protein [Apilactobacillus timberlakei]TPR12769.1 hypothetical protein DY048_07095 [Apilactobacillus timberlakei]TPR13652.1 hypothetical protein DY052_07965 [Apilactobacillus timberlakei]
MQKVKVITSEHNYSSQCGEDWLTDEINKFVEDNNIKVISIQYQNSSTYTGNEQSNPYQFLVIYSAMIFYEERKED